MKKLMLLALAFCIIFQALIIPAHAQSNIDKVYGLLSILDIVEYADDFDYKRNVSSDAFNKIINAYFGVSEITQLDPTNSDAVQILSAYAPVISDSKNSIAKFKDFGFIRKEHRIAYKKMCYSSILDTYGEYLQPYKELRYDNLFLMLINFEEYLLKNNNMQIQNGTISDVFSSKNDIVIKQRADGVNKEYRFARDADFLVYDNGKLGGYSFNIKRGQTAKFYLKDDNIAFVYIYEDKGPLDDSIEIGKGKIYICNEYDNELILINDVNDYYTVLSYDFPLIYEGTRKLTISDINNSFLDRNCYYIKEKDTNKVKYINITG